MGTPATWTAGELSCKNGHQTLSPAPRMLQGSIHGFLNCQWPRRRIGLVLRKQEPDTLEMFAEVTGQPCSLHYYMGISGMISGCTQHMDSRLPFKPLLPHTSLLQCPSGPHSACSKVSEPQTVTCRCHVRPADAACSSKWKNPSCFESYGQHATAQRPWRVSRHQSERHDIEGRIQKLRPQPTTAVMKVRYKYQT